MSVIQKHAMDFAETAVPILIINSLYYSKMNTDHLIEWINFISLDSDCFVAHAVIHVEIPIDSTEWECNAIMVVLHALREKFNKRHCETPQQDSKGS